MSTWLKAFHHGAGAGGLRDHGVLGGCGQGERLECRECGKGGIGSWQHANQTAWESDRSKYVLH